MEEHQLLVSKLQQVDLSEKGGENSELMSESVPSLEEVEDIIRYKFKDRRLLEQAFTDASSQDVDFDERLSYQRLEYVGDSVLGLFMAKEHYFMYPDLLPGPLTRLRAANVDKEKLARVAVKHKLHRYLRHRKPLLDGQIREFTEASSKYPYHSKGLIDAPKVLADIVESTIGAIFIDSNSSMDTTWKVVKNLLQPLITPENLQTHPVTKLYEICQKNALQLKFVDLWSETGEIEVFVDDEFVGKGEYSQKKLIAINRAADNAYIELARKLSVDNNSNELD